MSAPVDIAFTYNETEDCVGSFRRLVTTTTSFRDFNLAEHQPPHRRGRAVSLCSLLSMITRTGGLLLFLLRVSSTNYARLTAPAVFYQLVTTKTGCRVLLKSEEERRTIASATTKTPVPLGHGAGGRHLRLRCNGSYGRRDHYAATSVFSRTSNQFSEISTNS